MADSVRVQFSASIGALIKGVDDAKKAIDSVKESTDRVTEGAKSLLEAFGIAFSVEKIVEFINRMGELGERTEHMAAILGVGTDQIGRLDAIARGTGTSTEGLAKALEIFQVNLQKARTGTGPAAEALQALGLSARDFIGLPLDAQLAKFADAVSKFADGGTKLAAVRALLGRMGDDLIPTLDKGSAGLRELGAMADRAGTALNEATVKAFSETHLKLEEMGLSFQGLGIRIFTVLEPAIDKATVAITKFVEGIDSKTIETALKNVATAVIDVLEKISTLFVTVSADFQELVARMGGLDLKRMALNVLEPGLGDLVLGKDNSLADKLKEIEETAKQRVESIAKLAAEYRKAVTEFKPFDLGGEEGEAKAPKPQVPQMPDLKGALAAQLQGYQADIKSADDAFKLTENRLASEVKLHKITQDEETAQLLDALQDRKQDVDEAYDASMEAAKNDAKQYAELQKKKMEADDAFALKHQQIVQKQLEDDTKQWQAVLQPIESAFNSQLRSLLAGTETFGQAMRKVFADLAIVAIEYIEKIILEFVALKIASALGFGPEQLAGALKAIGANSGVIFSGEVANLAPALGPAAPAAAAAITAGATATAIGLSSTSLETGAWEVPGGRADLHPGEMVIPQTFATALRSAVGSGGGAGAGGDTHFHFNGPVVGTQQWLTSMKQQLTSVVRNQTALTPSMSFG